MLANYFKLRGEDLEGEGTSTMLSESSPLYHHRISHSSHRLPILNHFLRTDIDLGNLESGYSSKTSLANRRYFTPSHSFIPISAPPLIHVFLFLLFLSFLFHFYLVFVFYLQRDSHKSRETSVSQVPTNRKAGAAVACLDQPDLPAMENGDGGREDTSAFNSARSSFSVESHSGKPLLPSLASKNGSITYLPLSYALTHILPT